MVLPIGDCQGSFQRPDEFREDGVTSIDVRLYAVYGSSAETFPVGKYFVILLRRPIVGGVPSQTAYALSMTDDGISGIQYGCNQTPEQMVEVQHLTTTIVAPTPPTPSLLATSPTRQPEPLAYTVCSEGYGWMRPSLDDQRRHLTSLGGEFQQLAIQGYLFEGAYVADAQGREVWRFGLFWALVNVVGDTVVFTARPTPGYFEYIQYAPRMDIHRMGYRLQTEDGTFLDACCT